MLKLTELLYKILDPSNLPAKRQLCRELANYYLQSAKKSEPEIKQLKDEVYKKRSYAMCDGFRLALLESFRTQDKVEAFLYNLGAKFPFLLILTKQSTLERKPGYSNSPQ